MEDAATVTAIEGGRSQSKHDDEMMMMMMNETTGSLTSSSDNDGGASTGGDNCTVSSRSASADIESQQQREEEGTAPANDDGCATTDEQATTTIPEPEEPALLEEDGPLKSNSSLKIFSDDCDDDEDDEKETTTRVDETLREQAPPPPTKYDNDDDDTSLHNNNNKATTTTTSAAVGGGGGVGGSLELRKIQNTFFSFQQQQQQGSFTGSSLGDDDDKTTDGLSAVSEEDDDSRHGFDCLFRPCFNPRYSLRSQLLLSFGTVNAIAIIVVVLVCILVSNMVGQNVKEINQASFERLVIHMEGTTARYLAEALAPRLVPADAVNIMYQAVRDRFAGYPWTDNMNNNNSDAFVPFPTTTPNHNQYPIKGKPLPLDWQITRDVTDDNYQEHVQERWPLFQNDPAISTANAAYFMQGMCDPSQNDNPAAVSYLENCTTAHNNLTTGGVVAPSPTNRLIHEKASDLVPLLKSLYEYHQDVRDLGYYFANSGAGASVNFPHYQLFAQATYTSTGCEWMLETVNPYTGIKGIATPEEIQRCHAQGTTVSSRNYNPLERDWCRDQAQNPNLIRTIGPYLDAWRENNWLVSSGKAVYVNHEFLCCMYIGTSISDIETKLKQARTHPSSQVTLVKWDEAGTVVGSTAYDIQQGGTIVTVTELDDMIGVTPEYYKQLLNLVDFDSQWDPAIVRQTYEGFTTAKHGDYFLSAYPIPPVPENYTALYTPEFLVIMSTSQDAPVLESVERVDSQVDDSVNQVMYLSLIVGGIGMILAWLIIWIMSFVLTAPLAYMNSASDEIINNFGTKQQQQQQQEQQIVSSSKARRCSPRTELDDVVHEFNKMVLSFSGSSITRTKKKDYTEVSNDFTLQAYFKDLYESRSTEDFKYKLNGETKIDEKTGEAQFGLINFGSNTTSFPSSASVCSTYTYSRGRHNKTRQFDSPLFVWTVILIATPLLLTTITIAAVVMISANAEFENAVQNAKAAFVHAELNSLETAARLRADLVSADLARPLRDLHLLTRYTSWLLFGGVEQQRNDDDGFAAVTTGVQTCRNELRDYQNCDYVQETKRCDCAWNERHNGDGDDTCVDYEPDSSRPFQLMFYAGQSQDSSTETGVYNVSSFPRVAYNAQSTSWYDDNVKNVPGSSSGSGNANAGRRHAAATTYDRLRGTAAVPLLPLLYNQDAQKEYFIASYIAYEADGGFFGYSGCNNWKHVRYSNWTSSKDNGAALLRPELCPEGKFGYDPRCRGWYDSGRQLLLEQFNQSSLHTTPPYSFASSGIFAQSATAPLFDPVTKQQHVGQTLVDYSSEATFRVLDAKNTILSKGGFPVLITVQSDHFGAETIVGPGFSRNESAKNISELVLPYDYNCPTTSCLERHDKFLAVLSKMKAGETGVAQFERSSSSSTDTIYMAYSPVIVKGYRPLDASNFSRGVERSDYLIYSLGVAETHEGLLLPFTKIEQDMDKQIYIAIGIISAVILCAVLFVIGISYLVTLSFTNTVLFLLDWIRGMNKLNDSDDLPIVDRRVGCREILKVADAMDSLYQVVKCANSTYFAGDLESAYIVLRDGLRLFKRLDNQKAIAIASNNLGNIMLAMYRSLSATGQEEMAGLTRQDIIFKGTVYFRDAIKLGESAYEEFYDATGWSPDCLDFMQHLSDRYFNRAMFLLSVKPDHPNPEEMQEIGFRDLQIARDMDVEIVAEGEQGGWHQKKRVAKLFNVALRRARGHIILQEMGYPDDWDLGDVIHEAFLLLQREQERGSSDLFASSSAIGRLQLIETELIKYKLLKGDVKMAAQVAIRMLVQDEFIFYDAQSQAVRALIAWLDSPESGKESHKMARVRLESYRRGLSRQVELMDRRRLSQNIQAESELEFMSAVRKRLGDSARSLSSSRSTSIRDSVREDVVMETF